MFKNILKLSFFLFVLSSCSQMQMQVKNQSPWGEFENECKVMSDSNAVYIYESNVKKPEKLSVLAKMIVDKSESTKNPLHKLNEFEYRKEVHQYESNKIPKSFKELKGMKNLKISTRAYLSDYDFENKRFSIGLKENSLFQFEHGYILKFQKIDDFNYINISPEKAEELVKNLKLGHSDYQRELVLDIYFEPVEFNTENLTFKHFRNKEFKVVSAKIHSMRIFHKPLLTKKEIYMFSLINDDLYDVKKREKIKS